MRRIAVCVAVLALTGALTAPAFAALPAPLPAPSPTATPDPRTAAQLAQEVAARQRALAGERTRLAAAAADVTATLQAYQDAQRAADLADREATATALALTQAVRRTKKAQAQFDGYVGALYRTGVTDPRVLLLSAAVAAPTSSGFFDSLGLAERAGDSQSHAIDELAAAQTEQDQQAQQAAAARTVQQQAAADASTARVAADTVLAAAAARVAQQDAALGKAQGVFAVARTREANLAKAQAIAVARARLYTGPPRGRCTRRDLRGYDNGALPPEALCSLWGTTGMVLQADAAAAFDRLSHDYAAQFGRPICVTDSYRSFEQQVAVRIAKPTLAAEPGTSNHGWGVAVDLCDGVEQFTTPTHAWLLAHAAQFGWFHPAWAEPTGVKPEAWHWEYAGFASAQQAP
jgi:hypothetical protein